MKITIGYLYHDLMNIYGDTGNIICLKKRAEWRGIEVEVKNISLKDPVPTIDLFFFGGGQDQAQIAVADDLQTNDKGKIIKSEVEKGVPLLSICGGYQLLGEYYQPHQGPKLPGIELFPAYTVASFDRMIGNMVIQSSAISLQTSDSLVAGKPLKTAGPITESLLVGFENHSGKTYLKKGGLPLGKVVKGFGNNGKDKTEGCIYKNAVGCYMHGSLLPKNPTLTDWFLTKALEVKYQDKIVLKPLNDELENKAHQSVISKVLR